MKVRENIYFVKTFLKMRSMIFEGIHYSFYEKMFYFDFSF